MNAFLWTAAGVILTALAAMCTYRRDPLLLAPLVRLARRVPGLPDDGDRLNMDEFRALNAIGRGLRHTARPERTGGVL